MPRVVDKRKTAKALRKLKRVAERAEGEGGPGLSTWEKEFVSGVTGRLEKYGSAFRDPAKGRLEDALSQRQSQVARVIDKKSRKAKAVAADPNGEDKKPEPPRPRSTFKRKPPKYTPRGRDINDDIAEDAETLAKASPQARRASLKVVPGGEKS